MHSRGKTEEPCHAQVLPGHQCVRAILEILIALTGGLLLVAGTCAPLAADNYAAAMTGLLCCGCFLRVLYRRRKSLPESPGQSTTLAMLLACLLVAGLFEPPSMQHGDLLLLPALMATLRHLVLPLAIFTYWMVFCGPVAIRRHSSLPMLPMLPMLPLMYVSLPRHLADVQGWTQTALHVLMIPGIFLVTVLLLKLGKDYLIDAARRSASFRA